MKNKLIVQLSIIGIILLGLNSCFFSGKRGNGNIVEKEISISDYTKLKLSGQGSLIYEQKPNEQAYLRIEIDENLFPLLEINSNDNSLSIEHKNIRPTKYNIYTNSRELAEMSISGSSDIQLKGTINTDNFKISTSGSNKISGEQIHCNLLETRLSGSSKLMLGGEAKKAEYHISGSGNINSLGLNTDSLEIRVSGSGDIEAVAEKNLDVHISGSGKVKYKGNPTIQQSISGSGSITSIN